jgi:hypothetical protein
MDKRDFALACLSVANGANHSPVQVQKLFFLIEKNIPEEIDGPYFNFHSYNYGPFDKSVYEVLEELALHGYVEIGPERNWKSYKLSQIGQERGQEVFDSMSVRAKNYIQLVSNFVRSLSFTQLISAIYKAYPDMRVNSVFQD